MSLLLRQPDPTQQVGITRVGTETVEARVKFDCVNVTASGKGLLQSYERGALLAERSVIHSRTVGVVYRFARLGQIFS
jgi:hypothetical protein